MKQMPDIMLLRLIDECTRSGPMSWDELQALVEHTISPKPTIWTVESTIAKDYLSLCAQPECDFLINLLFTGEGFHIIIADHTSLLETNVIPFDRISSIVSLVRMVMGLAFLPDPFLGIDQCVTRLETGSSSGKKFEDIFPVSSTVLDPHISLLSQLPSILSEARLLEISKTADSPLTISVSSQVYSIIKVIFESKSIVSRAMRIYLVRAADGSVFVLKNSWMSVRRPYEATYLEGLSFPFCPTLINHSAHRNTGILRSVAVKPTLVKEIREKRRSVTCPAGVHISDFSSLWELMVAFMDVALGMYGSIFVGYLLTLLPLPQPLCILS